MLLQLGVRVQVRNASAAEDGDGDPEHLLDQQGILQYGDSGADPVSYTHLDVYKRQFKKELLLY